MSLRVLVVDDSSFMIKAISRVLDAEADMQVVGTAGDGEEAIKKAVALKPDVITLDIEMPKKNGLEALREIMSKAPTAVIMCSTLTEKGSEAALEALRIGASDFVTKDASFISLNIEEMLKTELVAKVRALGGNKKRVAAAPPPPKTSRSVKLGRCEAVVIGSSTGGPPALEVVLRSLPATFTQPIVIAQHMPPIFSKSLAGRLNGMCTLRVEHAERSGPVSPGVVYVAEGGKHARLIRSASGSLALEVSEKPTDALYKPSVNELFHSAAKHVGSACLAIVLTGMGDDGAEGARALADKGAPILAQEASTCVVYGMPKAVVDAGIATAVLPPDLIGATLSRLNRASRSAA